MVLTKLVRNVLEMTVRGSFNGCLSVPMKRCERFLSTQTVPRPPRRGFDIAEFERRTERTQRQMHKQGVQAILVTTESDFLYYSGFMSQFWESPTRPWFLVIPAQGKPIAVVPSIGAVGICDTWIDDVRTWSSPNPLDDGISLLASTLLESASAMRGNHTTELRVGFSMGHESILRMPASNFLELRSDLSMKSVDIVDVRPLLRSIQAVKSEDEIDKIRHMALIASSAFQRLGNETLQSGMTEREAARLMTTDMLLKGADSTRYLIAVSGKGCYNNIIMGPTDRVMNTGDVLVIDTGTRFDGYFSDFDRNYAFGAADDQTLHAYRAVWEATEAGIAASVPGNRTCDVFQAMQKSLKKSGYDGGGDVGRMGHGLGTQLTEWPSLMASDETVLEPGMALAIEPGVSFGNGLCMVHEENIVVREDSKPELLSIRAPEELPIILR